MKQESNDNSGGNSNSSPEDDRFADFSAVMTGGLPQSTERKIRKVSPLTGEWTKNNSNLKFLKFGQLTAA
jgi:hypothetical protein